MGDSKVVTDVEDRLPGVRFRIDRAERHKKSAYITLRCDIEDTPLYEACIAKLDGLKIFTGDLVEEVLGALGAALTDKEQELLTQEKEAEDLAKRLEAAEAEVVRLRKLMHGVGMQLGIEQG
jgi:hypothetical protein